MDVEELMRINKTLDRNLQNMNLWALKCEQDRDYFKKNFENISQEFKKYIENENSLRAKRERIIEELTEDIKGLFKENQKFERYLKQINDLTKENKKLIKIINNLKPSSSDQESLFPMGTTSLLHATEQGNLLASKFWINIIETSVHIRDKNTQNTPMHIAASHGHVQLIEYFISLGADINAENSLEERPLYCAAFNGHPSSCKILIENGAEINAQTKTGITALQSAFLNYHWEVVEFLISYGANIENSDYLGYRLLHYSVIRKDLTLIKLLVEKGASVNAKGINNGKTPLHLAYEGGKNNIIKYLILHGADENICDFEGKIPEEYDKIWMTYKQKNI